MAHDRIVSSHAVFAEVRKRLGWVAGVDCGFNRSTQHIG
jgi:hypothetical protein